jgi:hypothetical protein
VVAIKLAHTNKGATTPARTLHGDRVHRVGSKVAECAAHRSRSFLVDRLRVESVPQIEERHCCCERSHYPEACNHTKHTLHEPA